MCPDLQKELNTMAQAMAVSIKEVYPVDRDKQLFKLISSMLLFFTIMLGGILWFSYNTIKLDKCNTCNTTVLNKPTPKIIVINTPVATKSGVSVKTVPVKHEPMVSFSYCTKKVLSKTVKKSSIWTRYVYTLPNGDVYYLTTIGKVK